MRRSITMLIVGLMLGTTGTGFAASQGFWHHTGPWYSCSGMTTNGFICKRRGSNYSVSIFRDGSFGVFFYNHAIFGCDNITNDPYSDCNDFR